MNPMDGLVNEPKIVSASPMFSITIARIQLIERRMTVTRMFIFFDISPLKRKLSTESFAGKIHKGVAKTTVNNTHKIPIVNPTFAS